MSMGFRVSNKNNHDSEFAMHTPDISTPLPSLRMLIRDSEFDQVLNTTEFKNYVNFSTSSQQLNAERVIDPRTFGRSYFDNGSTSQV